MTYPRLTITVIWEMNFSDVSFHLSGNLIMQPRASTCILLFSAVKVCVAFSGIKSQNLRVIGNRWVQTMLVGSHN